MMLITLVQSIIGAFDENLPPFNERGGKKASQGTENDLLHESSLPHTSFDSTSGTAAYQKPHWLVCMIHSPRHRLATECATTHDARLRVT